MMELAFYAIVAMFIIGRLYASLGRSADAGYSSDTIREGGKVIDMREEDAEPENVSEFVDPERMEEVRTVIDDIKTKFPHFSLQKFIQGAEKAFDFIIQSINSAEEANLKKLLDKELFKNMKAKIAERKAKNATHHTTVICIQSAKIVSASLEKKSQLTIGVKFISEQISWVTDEKEEAIEGDPKAIIMVEDNWNFRRDLNSSSPNWLLASIA